MEYFEAVRKLSVNDWEVIAQFHRIIKNYKKLKMLIEKHKVKC